MKKIMYIGLCAALLGACDKYDTDTPTVKVSAPQTVRVGEKVNFHVEHNAQLITVYTGDEGHAYVYSADYLLKGKSEQDIKNNVYRREKPGIVPFLCDFADIAPNTVDLPDYVKVSANNGTNVMGDQDTSIGQIVEDGGRNVLRQQLAETAFTSRVITVYPCMQLGENKNIVFRFRFSDPAVYGPGATAGIRMVTHLYGVGVGETVPTVMPLPNTFYDPGVGNNYCTFPSSTYFEYTYSLSQHIEKWQQQYGKVLGTLVGVKVMIGNTNGYGKGNVFIESIKVGGVDLLPFDTGQSVTVDNSSGQVDYSYTYDTPGTYTVTVLGINTSWKKYSGKGYQDDRGDNINGSEYDYKVGYATMNITVEP